jgi:hypothetical protein
MATAKKQESNEKLFGTAELLEMISNHLDMQSLFVLQRVCKQWLQVIQGRPPYQHAMLLSPRLEWKGRVNVQNADSSGRFGFT